MAIFQHTTVLRSFEAVFDNVRMKVEVWRVHDGYSREYYYAAYISDREEALRFMDEEAARAGLPIFFKRVMIGGQPEWFGGAGYRDLGLPGRLGPVLDQAAGSPLPLADNDNPFVNAEGEGCPTITYRASGWRVVRRRGVYSNALYHLVMDRRGRARVIVRCPGFTPVEDWRWLPASDGPRSLEEFEAAGTAIDQYERRRGLVVVPSYGRLVPEEG